MDEKTFKETVGRLREVSDIVGALPAEIRAQAFTLLQDYIKGTPSLFPSGKAPLQAAAGAAGHSTKSDTEQLSREDFFAAHHDLKPADNVKLLAAFLYSEYGSEPFSAEEIDALAREVGLTIPERADMTLAQSKADGKSLFARAGRGTFKPTVYGETYFKTAFAVRKGTKQKPVAE